MGLSLARIAHVGRLAAEMDNMNCHLPSIVTELCKLLLHHVGALDEQISALDRQVRERAREDETARRLMTIPASRPDLRDSLGSAGTTARDLCQRARLRGLARPHAAAKLLRRQSPARAHLADGAARPEAITDHWRDGRGAGGQARRACRFGECETWNNWRRTRARGGGRLCRESPIVCLIAPRALA